MLIKYQGVLLHLTVTDLRKLNIGTGRAHNQSFINEIKL